MIANIHSVMDSGDRIFKEGPRFNLIFLVPLLGSLWSIPYKAKSEIYDILSSLPHNLVIIIVLFSSLIMLGTIWYNYIDQIQCLIMTDHRSDILRCLH